MGGSSVRALVFLEFVPYVALWRMSMCLPAESHCAFRAICSSLVTPKVLLRRVSVLVREVLQIGIRFSVLSFSRERVSGPRGADASGGGRRGGSRRPRTRRRPPFGQRKKELTGKAF